MKKLMTLTIEGLKLPQQLAFISFVLEAVSRHPIVGERFPKAVAMLTDAYELQDDLHQRHDRKRLTREMQEADARRDKWLRKLRNNLGEIVEFGAGEKKAEAEFLLAVVDEYGGAKIPDYQMDYETGQLSNLYDDLQQRYAEKLALLGLTAVVEGAQEANEAFKEALRRRTQSDADYGKGAMEKARAETDSCYRYLVDSVNVEARIDTEGVLTPFIDYLNVEIDRMRRLAGQGTAPGGGDSGAEGGVSIPTKTVRFEFKNGRVEIVRAEVGAAYLIPLNTEGYVWDPLPTGVMPAKNTTFREVALEDREVVLTFHFLSHEDEELRGVVGTLLTAPVNTDGCHWEPNVPNVFPEEDMTFNEVLDESDVVKYTVAWYLPDGNPIVWYELAPGEVIPEAPTPPEGYYWHPYPDVMPEHDLDIIPEPIRG